MAAEKLARSPYWLRLRGCGGDKEWDTGIRHAGHDYNKGVELYLGTEQGALILRVHADDAGNVAFRLVRHTHLDARNIERGENRHIVDGLVKGGAVTYESDLPAVLQGKLSL